MKISFLFCIMSLFLSFSSFAQTRPTSKSEQIVWLKNVKKDDPNNFYAGRKYPEDPYYGIDNYSDYNDYHSGEPMIGIGRMSESYFKSISIWIPYYDRPSNCTTLDYKPELNRILSTPGIPTKDGDAVIQRQPRPLYSKSAYSAKTEGTIKLNVQLKADGTIGKITPLNSLSNELTQSAMKAACYITFYPASSNKKFVDSTQTVIYTFNLDQVEKAKESDVSSTLSNLGGKAECIGQSFQK